METAQNFPQDYWSQRDDFHGRELRRVIDLANERGIPVEEVLRAVDDDIHRRRVTTPDARDDRNARAIPCKPRPSTTDDAPPRRTHHRPPRDLRCHRDGARLAMLPSAGWLNEFRDAQVMTLHERVAVDTVRRFGQIPLRNPWYCGGLYGLGAPQSRFASPPFLLRLLFGPERAEPLVIFLFSILGMEGTYRWINLRVNDASAALRVAPFFALSGHFAVAYFRGWTNFFGFELVPFVLFGITLAARGRTRGIAIAAIAFAAILGFGGTFAAPLVAVAATVEGLRSLIEQPPRRKGRAAAMLAATASFMAAVAAVRLLPIAETLAAAPRLMAGTPGHSPKELLWFLVRSLEVKSGDVEGFGLFFVGGAFLALVALGGSDRKSLPSLVILIGFLWLSAGYARRPALFALLR